MPMIDARSGFTVRVYINNHLPAHIHVARAGKSVIIEIGASPVQVRTNLGLKVGELRRAIRIAEENREQYLAEWRRIHG